MIGDQSNPNEKSIHFPLFRTCLASTPELEQHHHSWLSSCILPVFRMSIHSSKFLASFSLPFRSSFQSSLSCSTEGYTREICESWRDSTTHALHGTYVVFCTTSCVKSTQTLFGKAKGQVALGKGKPSSAERRKKHEIIRVERQCFIALPPAITKQTLTWQRLWLLPDYTDHVEEAWLELPSGQSFCA